MTSEKPRPMTVPQAVRWLRAQGIATSRYTLYRRMRDGTLKPHRSAVVGGQKIIDARSLERMIRQGDIDRRPAAARANGRRRRKAQGQDRQTGA